MSDFSELSAALMPPAGVKGFDLGPLLSQVKFESGFRLRFEPGQLVQAKPNSQADIRYRLSVRIGQVLRCRAAGKDFFGYRYEVLFTGNSETPLQVEIPEGDLQVADGLSVVFNEVP